MRFKTAVPLGKGAMGEVLECWDPQLERHVALKFLRSDDPESVARMQREARLQGRVRHPNVVEVYEVGSWDGRPYIAMQRVHGEPLDQAARELPLERRVELLATVAEAVHAAHRVGLIHRDLKPSNILVEIGDDGLPKPFVLDFGIAREMAVQGETVTGQILGTPGYLSPEQARGETTTLDRRSDVFALGALAYQVLTGAAAFGGSSAVDSLVAVLEHDPLPPRRHVPSLPRELETIVLHCLEKQPERRYPSARLLAEDLRSFLDGRPIAARPPGRLESWARRVRRHPVAAAASAVALVVLVTGCGIVAHERYTALQKMRLAQRFGQEVERVDAVMRQAHLAPLHDLSAERRLVEERLAWIGREMEELGGIADGPGHYALGRGNLALGRPAEARVHLEAAWEGGFQTPETAYALGETLGELFAEAREQAQRTKNAEEREAQLREVQQELRDPALRYLRLGAAAATGPPAYLEGLIDFYEARYDEAIAAAGRARVDRPWFYEPLLLEGRARYQLGVEHFWTGDHERALAESESARQLFEQAAEIARSQPEPWVRLCANWQLVVDLQFTTGKPAEDAFRHTLAACDRALVADPQLAMAWDKKARAWWRWSEDLQRRGEDPAPAVEEVIAHARRAGALDPESFLAPNLEALAWWVRARHEAGRGLDPEESIRHGLEAAARSAAINPRYRHAHNNGGLHHLTRAEYLDSSRGDSRASWEAAGEAFRRALEVDPDYIYGYGNLGIVLGRLAKLEARQGGDPRPYHRQGLEAADKALAINPEYANGWQRRASILLDRAAYTVATGGAPDEDVEAAVAAIRRALAINSSDPNSHEILARLQLVRALELERRGAGDPRPHLAAARAAAEEALDLGLRSAGLLWVVAKADLMEAEDRLGRGGDPRPLLRSVRQRGATILEINEQNDPTLRLVVHSWLLEARSEPSRAAAEAALERARPWLEKARQASDGPEPWVLAAEIELEQAKRALAAGRSPHDLLAASARAIEEARRRQPHDTERAVVEAELHLERARWQRSEGRDPAASLAASLGAADEALGVDPSWRRALAVRAAARELAASAPRRAEAASAPLATR